MLGYRERKREKERDCRRECGRSREGWLDMERLGWRFRHLQGVENIPTWVQRRAGLVWLSRAISRGAMASRGTSGSKGKLNWTARIFTGHKGWPSLRRKLYHTRGHQGTAPRTLFVAFNPLSLSLSLSPLSLPPSPLLNPCPSPYSGSKLLEYVFLIKFWYLVSIVSKMVKEEVCDQ